MRRSVDKPANGDILGPQFQNAFVMLLDHCLLLDLAPIVGKKKSMRRGFVYVVVIRSYSIQAFGLLPQCVAYPT